MKKTDKDFNVKSYISKKEVDQRERFHDLFKHCPIPDNDILNNLPLFMKRQNIARLLYFNDLYKEILNIHGVIMEFGVRWGPNLALLQSFRAIYEPYNYTRKIIGFDTFEGFESTHGKDGDSDIIHKGAYDVSENYEDYLSQVLTYHESEAPIDHIEKFELIKGDVVDTAKIYLDDHPETIIALAIFDMDIYHPTKEALLAIKERLVKGSIVAFDELNHPDFPGETIAFREVFGSDYQLRRSPLNPYCSYIVI
tara:strand:+ start:264 stop:1022 length:759 start_codon:yes stop_codon:yes gene_type:complete